MTRIKNGHRIGHIFRMIKILRMTIKLAFADLICEKCQHGYARSNFLILSFTNVFANGSRVRKIYGIFICV